MQAKPPPPAVPKMLNGREAVSSSYCYFRRKAETKDTPRKQIILGPEINKTLWLILPGVLISTARDAHKVVFMLQRHFKPICVTFW